MSASLGGSGEWTYCDKLLHWAIDVTIQIGLKCSRVQGGCNNALVAVAARKFLSDDDVGKLALNVQALFSKLRALGCVFKGVEIQAAGHQCSSRGNGNNPGRACGLGRFQESRDE